MLPPAENRKTPRGEFLRFESNEDSRRGGRYNYQKSRSFRSQARMDRRRLIILTVIGALIAAGVIVITVLR